MWTPSSFAEVTFDTLRYRSNSPTSREENVLCEVRTNTHEQSGRCAQIRRAHICGWRCVASSGRKHSRSVRISRFQLRSANHPKPDFKGCREKSKGNPIPGSTRKELPPGYIYPEARATVITPRPRIPGYPAVSCTSETRISEELFAEIL